MMKNTVELVEYYMKKKLMKLKNGLAVMFVECGIIGSVQVSWRNQSLIYVSVNCE